MTAAWARRAPAAAKALLALAVLVAASLAPPAWVAGIAVAVLAALLAARARVALLATLVGVPFAVLTALTLAFLLPSGVPAAWGPVRAYPDAFVQGAIAGGRMLVAVAASLGAAEATPPRDALRLLRRLPRLAHAAAAVARLGPDLARDARAMAEARRVRGLVPAGRWRRVLAAPALLVPLVVRAARRGLAAEEALRASGHERRAVAWGVVLVFAALAAAGRLAFLALPNVAPTFFVAFLAGAAYGARAGALVGALAMLATNLLITGLHPVLLVNSPAMALVGAAGGALAPAFRRAPAAVVASLAGLVGVLVTLGFSLAADATTWALFYRNGPDGLRALVLAGLAFNVFPAAVNALVFAAATRPCLEALAAAGLTTRAGDARGPLPPPREAPT